MKVRNRGLRRVEAEDRLESETTMRFGLFRLALGGIITAFSVATVSPQGQSRTSTIRVETNKTYDSHPSLQGPISLSVFSLPAA